MGIASQNTNDETTKKYAVLTGASRGLGRAFAEELSRQGIPTVLISSNPTIADLCEHLRQTYRTECDYIIANLTRKEEVLSAADTINSHYEVFQIGRAHV